MNLIQMETEEEWSRNNMLERVMQYSQSWDKRAVRDTLHRLYTDEEWLGSFESETEADVYFDSFYAEYIRDFGPGLD